LGPAFSARGILVWETSINPKGGHMKLIGTITVLAAAVAALLVPMAGAAPTARPAAAQLSQFEGTVVSVNHDARTFRLRDTERGTARIKVTSRTRFERIAGFSALRPGMRRIEAKVKRRNGAWVAAEVERSGGGASTAVRTTAAAAATVAATAAPAAAAATTVAATAAPAAGTTKSTARPVERERP
jgi:hypothetical protein